MVEFISVSLKNRTPTLSMTLQTTF